ncbi:hypothetical protein [Brucella tritici]|uniref:hypothetical protein n=1 Tax=Brucella tritici TaxID=94626 RepID=UPI002001C7E5|nr:hypothetical protein [Brucella tritici]
MAGIGAFIANFAAKWIESWSRSSQSVESQRDADLQEILLSAKLLCDHSEKLWVKSAAELGSDEIILRAHMIAQQHQLAEIISELFKGTDKQDCDVEFHRLATAATGGDFGDPNRDAEPGRLNEILIASRSLERRAKKARRSLKRKFMA